MEMQGVMFCSVQQEEVVGLQDPPHLGASVGLLMASSHQPSQQLLSLSRVCAACL